MTALHKHVQKALDNREHAIAKHKKDTRRAAELRHARDITAAGVAGAASLAAAPNTPTTTEGHTP